MDRVDLKITFNCEPQLFGHIFPKITTSQVQVKLKIKPSQLLGQIDPRNIVKDSAVSRLGEDFGQIQSLE